VRQCVCYYGQTDYVDCQSSIGHEGMGVLGYTIISARRCEFECDNVAGYGLDDGELQVVRCKPEGIEELSRNTKFTRKELQIMYRGFKQVVAISFDLQFSSAI